MPNPLTDLKPPAFRDDAFHCPWCSVYAHQYWNTVVKRGSGDAIPDTWVSACHHCREHAIWVNERMVYPARAAVPIPNTDLPDDVRADYNEAANVLPFSPRSTAALMRLALQKLVESFGYPGGLDESIKTMVEKGLPVTIQQSLDALRVIGNNAVHPGELDLRDDATTASALFGLLNLIADYTISQPKRIADIYAKLPETSRAAIEKRDAATSGTTTGT
jgi:hypothetical protein